MKFKLAIATIAGCAALAACGDGAEDNTANADANMMTDMNAGMTDMNMPADNLTVDANNVTVIENGGTTDLNADANATANSTNTM